MSWPKTTNIAHYLIGGQLVKGPYSISDAKNFLSKEESFETSKFMGKICFDGEAFGIWVMCRTTIPESYPISAYWIRVTQAKEVFHKRGVSIIGSLEEYQEIAKQLPHLKTLLLLEGIDFSEAV